MTRSEPKHSKPAITLWQGIQGWMNGIHIPDIRKLFK